MDYTAEDFRLDLEVVRVTLGRGGAAPEGLDWVKAITDGIATGTARWGENHVSLGTARRAQFVSAVASFNLSSEDEWVKWMATTPSPMTVEMGSAVYISTPP
jgi:hypothetical protein